MLFCHLLSAEVLGISEMIALNTDGIERPMGTLISLN
ncbi:hypothetical protein IAD21_00374 [Abditibacteriota bacterium]|nr:hypothetical protein IAD21_00374 [Abditibacteriota bacterium]